MVKKTELDSLKRKNKDGNIFVRGDRREDGYYFLGYRLPIQKSGKNKGLYNESWCTPDRWKKVNAGNKTWRGKKKAEFVKKGYNLPDALAGAFPELIVPKNPKTGENWVFGDVDYKEDKKEDYFFAGYKTHLEADGKTIATTWKRLAIKHELYVHKNLLTVRGRARRNNWKFNLDDDYLLSIYPKDNKCPATGVDLIWGDRGKQADNRYNSPSLDRINPSKGYVKGNVVWVSNKVNTIKNDVDTKTLMKVAKFYSDLERKLP